MPKVLKFSTRLLLTRHSFDICIRYFNRHLTSQLNISSINGKLSTSVIYGVRTLLLVDEYWYNYNNKQLTFPYLLCAATATDSPPFSAAFGFPTNISWVAARGAVSLKLNVIISCASLNTTMNPPPPIPLYIGLYTPIHTCVFTGTFPIN